MAGETERASWKHSATTLASRKTRSKEKPTGALPTRAPLRLMVFDAVNIRL
jgi:hypothetical protein